MFSSILEGEACPLGRVSRTQYAPIIARICTSWVTCRVRRTAGRSARLLMQSGLRKVRGLASGNSAPLTMALRTDQDCKTGL